MSVTLSVSHNAETAHRIPGLPGGGAKCGNVHGHSFWITWTFNVPNGSADDGAEFSNIKRVLRGWVDENLDHGYVCKRGDYVGEFLHDNGLRVLFLTEHPTTETLAELLATIARELLPDLDLARVHVQETRVNAAAWEADQ